MPNGVIWGGALDGSNHVGAMVTCQAITISPAGAGWARAGAAAPRTSAAATIHTSGTFEVMPSLPTRAGARTVSSGTPLPSPPSRVQVIEAGDVVAGDLATDTVRDAGEVLVERLQRVRPDAVGVRIVGSPDDVVLADERDDRLEILVLLVGHVALAAEVVAGP